MIAVVFVMVISTTHKTAYAYAENREDVVLNVEGMTCGGCENAVKAALLKCDGVKEAEVSHKKGKAVVKVEEDEVKTDELIAAVEKTGFSAQKAKNNKTVWKLNQECIYLTL